MYYSYNAQYPQYWAQGVYDRLLASYEFMTPEFFFYLENGLLTLNLTLPLTLILIPNLNLTLKKKYSSEKI